MTGKILIFSAFIISLFVVLAIGAFQNYDNSNSKQLELTKKSHWFELHRKSGVEYLYYGVMGDKENSELIREFAIRAGTDFETPTPLPELAGRDYWLIVKKESSADNPETAPYFLTLDVPVGDELPWGPVPYIECLDPETKEKIQCDWKLPGYFGLHGINGNQSKLTDKETGSYGCIRHEDADITYLYNLLDPENAEIRYYIKDI